MGDVNKTITEKCSLCNRPFGKHIEEHHLIPKTFKGKDLIKLHPACHRQIHIILSERELANYYNTIEKLLEHTEIQKFVKWISKKDPDFYVGVKDSTERKKKR
jgi:5-methylcytosine-specific restriction endonuclease McrA